jgi:cytochrome P450
MKGKIGLVTAAVALGVALLALLAYRSNQQLRAENRGLRMQIERLAQTPEPSQSNPQPGGVAEHANRLPEDQFTELLRLRGQVGVMRRQLDQQTASARVMRPLLDQQAASARQPAPSTVNSEPESTVDEAAIAVLDGKKAELQQELETSEQLLQTMNVPREIAEMDSAQVLKNTNLSAYWPYFEETRKREFAAAILKAVVDKIDSLRGHTNESPNPVR